MRTWAIAAVACVSACGGGGAQHDGGAGTGGVAGAAGMGVDAAAGAGAGSVGTGGSAGGTGGAPIGAAGTGGSAGASATGGSSGAGGRGGSAGTGGSGATGGSGGAQAGTGGMGAGAGGAGGLDPSGTLPDPTAPLPAGTWIDRTACRPPRPHGFGLLTHDKGGKLWGLAPTFNDEVGTLWEWDPAVQYFWERTPCVPESGWPRTEGYFGAFGYDRTAGRFVIAGSQANVGDELWLGPTATTSVWSVTPAVYSIVADWPETNMVFDPHRNSMFLTWVRFDELRSGQTTWTAAIGPTGTGQVGPRTGPAGYDPERATFVMVSPDDGMATSEYPLAGGQWVDRSTATAPSDVHDVALWWNPMTARIDMLVVAGPVTAPQVSVYEWDHVQGKWNAIQPSPGSANPGGIGVIEAVSADQQGRLVAWLTPPGAESQLWSWDAGARSWVRLSPERWPTLWPSSESSVAVYDSIRQRVVFAGSGFQKEVMVLDWNGTDPVFADRRGAPTAAWPKNLEVIVGTYDRHRRRLVICGHPNPGTYSELWEWDGESGTWTNRTPATLPAVWPSCAGNTSMAYDAGRRRVVAWAASNLDAALWEQDPQTGAWQQPALPNDVRTQFLGSPTTVVYDEKRARVVVASAAPAIAEWDGSAWTMPVPRPTGPASSDSITSAYHARRGRVVLLTGPAGSRRLRTWDGTQLTDETPAAFTALKGSPGGGRSALLYDLARGNLMLLSGVSSPNGVDGFTHVFEGSVP